MGPGDAGRFGAVVTELVGVADFDGLTFGGTPRDDQSRTFGVCFNDHHLFG